MSVGALLVSTPLESLTFGANLDARSGLGPGRGGVKGPRHWDLGGVGRSARWLPGPGGQVKPGTGGPHGVGSKPLPRGVGSNLRPRQTHKGSSRMSRDRNTPSGWRLELDIIERSERERD